jgi:hypothetical protein
LDYWERELGAADGSVVALARPIVAVPLDEGLVLRVSPKAELMLASLFYGMMLGTIDVEQRAVRLGSCELQVKVLPGLLSTGSETPQDVEVYRAPAVLAVIPEHIQRLLLHPKRRRQSFYERKTATWYVQVIYMSDLIFSANK